MKTLFVRLTFALLSLAGLLGPFVHATGGTQALAVLEPTRRAFAVDPKLGEELGRRLREHLDLRLAGGLGEELCSLPGDRDDEPRSDLVVAEIGIVDPVDARISFVQGPEGKIEHLILHQNGFDQKAKRLGADGQVDFSPAQFVTLPAEILDRYVGKYVWSPAS